MNANVKLNFKIILKNSGLHPRSLSNMPTQTNCQFWSMKVYRILACKLYEGDA